MILPRATTVSLWLCAASVCTAAEQAELTQTFLTVGQGWAAVREERFVVFTNVEQDVLLSDIPDTADLSSLHIRATDGSVSVTSWQRTSAMSGRGGISTVGPGISLTQDGNFLRWTPAQSSAVDRAQSDALRRAIRCRMSTDEPGVRQIEIIYLLGRMQWNASYQVLVRGELTNELERVSVDVDGRLEISNGTDRVFRNAHLTVVGTDRPPSVAEVRPPGILSLDRDNPLTDLLFPTPDALPSHVYRLPNSAEIGSRGESLVAFVSTSRKPAERIYRMSSMDHPLEMSPSGRPLDKFIVFKNDPASGLGLTLPPGPAQIYLGSQRTHLFQEAWFSRTPSNEEIRIEMGKAELVTGYRRSLGRTKSIGGIYQESFEINLVNQLSGAVAVEVEEEPPVAGAWEVNKSTHPNEVQGRKLVFSTKLAGKSSLRIAYTLRISDVGR